MQIQTVGFYFKVLSISALVVSSLVGCGPKEDPLAQASVRSDGSSTMSSSMDDGKSGGKPVAPVNGGAAPGSSPMGGSGMPSNSGAAPGSSGMGMNGGGMNSTPPNGGAAPGSSNMDSGTGGMSNTPPNGGAAPGSSAMN